MSKKAKPSIGMVVGGRGAYTTLPRKILAQQVSGWFGGYQQRSPLEAGLLLQEVHPHYIRARLDYLRHVGGATVGGSGQ